MTEENEKSKARRRLRNSQNAFKSQGKKGPQPLTIDGLAQITKNQDQGLQAQINKIDAAVGSHDVVIQNLTLDIQILTQTMNAQAEMIKDIIMEMDLGEEEVETTKEVVETEKDEKKEVEKKISEPTGKATTEKGSKKKVDK